MTFENITFSEDLAFLTLTMPKECWHFAIEEVQEDGNLIDLVKSLPTNIWLRKSASIQLTTSLSKFVLFSSYGIWFSPTRPARLWPWNYSPSPLIQLNANPFPSFRHSPPVSHLSFVVVLPATSVLLVQWLNAPSATLPSEVGRSSSRDRIYCVTPRSFLLRSPIWNDLS